jgi:methylmalonyl-CoA mutase N-terminal domain/subunit
VRDALNDLKQTCRNADKNVIVSLLEAVSADATVGEVGAVFRETFGEWNVPRVLRGM